MTVVARTSLSVGALAWLALAGCPSSEPTSPGPETLIDTSVDASETQIVDAVSDVPKVDVEQEAIGTDVKDSGPPSTDAGDAPPTQEVTDTADVAPEAGAETVDAGPPCSSDEDCVAAEECTQGSCNPATNTCEFSAAPDGTACTNSNPDCVESASCTDGACVETKKAADCGDKECGLDACNNSCGICPVGQLCDLESGSCTDPAAECLGIDFLGCCTGDGKRVRYCLQGQLIEEICGEGAVCGYDASSLFLCTTEPLDVPADAEYLCPQETCTQTCEDPNVECGYACGKNCNACPTDTYCTVDKACKACGCAAEWECGEDPCGNVCGSCPEGSQCLESKVCSSIAEPQADASSGDTSASSDDGPMPD